MCSPLIFRWSFRSPRTGPFSLVPLLGRTFCLRLTGRFRGAAGIVVLRDAGPEARLFSRGGARRWAPEAGNPKMKRVVSVMMPLPPPRRDFLRRSGMGLGMLGLADLHASETALIQNPHFAPKAKRIIHFFLNGG